MSDIHKPIDAAALLKLYAKRIELVRQCANESTQAVFERKWLSVLTRCAQWFSSMPLTPELHREPGGAFRATIESTFYAMRLAGGQKFAADLTSEKRRRLEPQYNFAVFLAAACSLLDEPCRHFEFTRLADHARWNPAAHGAFGSWLGDGGYTIERRTAPLKSERMRTAMFAQTVITAELLSGLDTAVLADLFGAINPERSPQGFEALVHKVVRQAMDVAVDFERKAQRGVFAPVKFDVPSAVHVALELQPQPAAPGASPASVPAAAASGAAAAPVHCATPPPISPSVGTSARPADASAQSPAIATAPVPAVASPAATTPQFSQSLLDALERSEALAASPVSADASPEVVKPVAVDPAAVSLPVSKAGRAGPTDKELDELFGAGSVMMREFFRALADDVATGKAKVAWEEKGLTVQKRLIGAYGMTSDALVEQLRKRSLLMRAHGNDICIVERAGRIIMERPAA
ncbi:TraI domain-containing protein [Caballeronia sp. LjRoot34]|uniref:TraI domain-containing protein n=1 Tax=Caballeronia sp. LjRoot34 TaxID=3342325 RepID=UPI003ED09C63